MLLDLPPRTLVLVAHPDDEAIGCGLLLQRMREPIVVFATDGAPEDEYFWRAHGSRETYAATRRAEAQQALAEVGVAPHFLNLAIDQELFCNLESAHAKLQARIAARRPRAILTLAYEGGHPDHDSCAFLAAQLGTENQLPVWEMPLYHRAGGEIRQQRFVDGEIGIEVEGRADELERKRRMIAAYASQKLEQSSFALNRECFRPQREYDFARPPHEGQLNYEVWQWRMTGAEVSASFGVARLGWQQETAA